jgi:putative peptidoglycan lipid II flippase
LGLVRDIILAYYLGTSHVTDAWFVAFRFPNLLRFHLTEGSLNAAFVPVYSECLETQGRNAARRLAGSVFTACSVLLLVLALIGIVGAPLIAQLVSPGFREVPGKLDLTAHLMRWTFVYLLLVGVAALGMAMLQSLGHFVSTALSQSFFNVFLIAAVFLICPLFGREPERWVNGLLLGALLSGLAVFLCQIPPLARRGMLPIPNRDIRHPGVVRVGRLVLPTLIGVTIGQLVVVVNTFLASLLGGGALASIEYAVRIVYMPQSICAGALSVAILPLLSRQISRNESAEFRQTLSYALRVVVFLMTPVALLLAIMSKPVIRLLLEYGQFSASSTATTALAMRCFTPFLFGASVLRVVTSGFLSLQSPATLVRVAALTLIVNLALGISLMGPMGVGGLALAAALAPCVGGGTLLALLTRRVGRLPANGWLRTLAVAVIGGAALVLVALAAGSRFPDLASPTLVQKLVRVALPAASGLAIYIFVAWIFRAAELAFIVRTLLRFRPRGSHS